MKFFKCEHCGNIVAFVKDKGVPISCCGEKMKELLPNTVDASQEKHVPVITQKGNNVVVNVGSMPHPMQEEHFIEWIAIQTKQGFQRKVLLPTFHPNVIFALTDGDELISVYSYCNLHGLWQTNK